MHKMVQYKHLPKQYNTACGISCDDKWPVLHTQEPWECHMDSSPQVSRAKQGSVESGTPIINMKLQKGNWTATSGFHAKCDSTNATNASKNVHFYWPMLRLYASALSFLLKSRPGLIISALFLGEESIQGLACTWTGRRTLEWTQMFGLLVNSIYHHAPLRSANQHPSLFFVPVDASQ